MKKKDNEETVITEVTPCFRNYRCFHQQHTLSLPHSDLVEIQQGDTVVLQKRSFHHLDGISASAYSIKSQLEDGFNMVDAGKILPSKRSIVDQSTEFMNNYKPITNE